jgi:RNA polymerase sigma factor (sigma-70 family)
VWYLLFVESNHDLVVRASSGDNAAAAELLQSVWPDAYRIAWSVLNDRQAAEDAAQEACARAWSSLRRLREPERFPIWFYRIVVNECRRLRRAWGREAAVAALIPCANEPPLEEGIDVRRAIEALDPRLRLAVLLRYYYQLNSTEIAEVVRASPVTVRWRLMLAHRRLRRLLEEPNSGPHARTQPEERHADESVVAN